MINSKDQVDHEIDHEANEPLVKPGAKFSMESVTLKTRSLTFFQANFKCIDIFRKTSKSKERTNIYTWAQKCWYPLL